MMKFLGFTVALIAVALGSFAQSAPKYHQTAKYTLGGEGFWDTLTYDPDGNRIFIAHNDSIVVMDAASGKQTGSIPASGAHGVALVPEKHLGFSTNGRAGTVTVFDTQTLKPQSDIQVGKNPDLIIYDPNTKDVIVFDGGSKDLMVIDPTSLKVVATVPLGGKPEFAAADASHVYVNIEDMGEIAVVDPKAWKVTQRWKLDGCEEPTGLALDEATDHLFAACGGKHMVVVNAKDGKIVASVPTGSSTDGAAFDPGLKVAFAPNGEGTLTVVREGSGGKYEVAENVTTQRGARTMALDPKSHKVFLPTAEFGPPAAGQTRPSVKPGSFMVLVYSPGS